MPQKVYKRFDLHIDVQRETEDKVLISAKARGQCDEARVPLQLIEGWTAGKQASNVPDQVQSIFSDKLIGEWLGSVEEEMKRAGNSLYNIEWLARIALQINDVELSRLAWERALINLFGRLKSAGSHLLRNQRLFEKPLVARISVVRPHSLSLPLMLPLRILQVDAGVGRHIKNLVPKKFGSLKDAEKVKDVNQAVALHECNYAKMETLVDAGQFPAVDVLHFDKFSYFANSPRLLSTALADTRGTLGWLEKITDIWQTKLIVFHCRTLSQLESARRLGAAIVNRGGPAILAEALNKVAANKFFDQFYDRLIHDDPLDGILNRIILHSSIRNIASRVSLFVGANREDSLRVSGVGVRLLNMADQISGRRARATDMRGGKITKTAQKALPEKFETLLTNSVKGLKKGWNSFEFEFHERDGLLPLSRNLRKIREVTGARPMLAGDAIMPRHAREARYVNSGFWREASDGLLKRIRQKEAQLDLGELYQLGIQIGPKDTQVITYGAMALVEEVFKWTPEIRGIWLEIGITGLDFKVLGDPVQRLWLPRDSATEMIYFAVIPQKTDVSRLRFCIYYKQNILQSFLLAAVTRSSNSGNPSAETRSKRLARSLEVPLHEIKDAGYLPKLEYSIAGTANDFETRPERALSIVANHLNGQPVITIKGPDIFNVQTENFLPIYVSNVRKALQEISTPPISGASSEKWVYGFGQVNQLNAGTVQTLKNALLKLANAGYQLYDAIISEDERPELEKTLKEPGQSIHVAHILLRKVIPWAVVYGRKYDANKKIDKNNQPLAHEVCMAALPDASGNIPAKQCEENTDCLLHPDQINKRLASNQRPILSETVVCPLHFWGIRHIIEIPAHQNDDTKKEPQPQIDHILAGPQAQLAAGIHARLKLVKQHLADLDAIALKPKAAAVWKSQAYQRDVIVDNLKDSELDFIYLYCHAHGGEADPSVNIPYLEFQALQDIQPGIIIPAALSHTKPWMHHPLVFLNGCGTVGFSPDALSPFITKLVRDRKASAVIGTEIPVWEPLASEMAKLFLDMFLGGVAAGPALMMIRRSLLSQYNPLGLVYTLYGAAHLTLDRRCPIPEIKPQ